MQVVFDFFVDPIIWPIYLYLGGYGLVWLIALLLSRLYIHKMEIERGVMRSWKIAFILHLLAGTALVAWLCFKAADLVKAWWYIILYMLPYTGIFLLDIFFLLFLNESSKGNRSSYRKRQRSPRSV